MERAHLRAVVSALLSRRAARAAAALLLLAAPAVAQNVYVVSPVPGAGDFQTVQAAVDAAADGDVLLIVPTTYFEAVVIADKRLLLAGLQPPGTQLIASIRSLIVRDVAASRSVLVRHLHVSASDADTDPLVIRDCEGPVLLEDVRVEKPGLAFLKFVAPKVERSEHVVLTRCILSGADSDHDEGDPSPGGPGLVVEDSHVALYDCKVTGGAGNPGSWVFVTHVFPSSAGGQGVQVWSGSLLVAGSEVRGGKGGDGNELLFADPPCLAPADGGSGVRTFGMLRVLDSVIVGGAEGVGTGCSGSAQPGQAVVVLAGGSLSTIPETARGLEISSPLEGGATVHISVHGQPGEMVLLLQALAPLGNFLAGLKGTLAGQPPYLSVLLGPLGGDGNLVIDVPLAVNVLPAGLQSVTFIDQLVGAASTGGGVLSSPTIVVLVDDVP